MMGQNTPLSDHKRSLRALPRPEPAGGSNYYVAEREKSLAFDTRRRENYQLYLDSARQGADVEYLPIKLDIENVSRCNFRCTMCVVSDWDKGRRAEDMTLEDFKKLIDEQYGVVEIKLQGVGEPLMQGDDLFEMIKYARSKSIWVRTTTNASLLHLRDNYRKLIDSGINEVQISVDGADKATFETIRRGSKFERVVENCKLINGYCAEKGIVRTKMWTVAQQANKHQLPEFVELAHALGFKSYVYTINLGDFALGKWKQKNEAASIENEWNPDVAVALMQRGEELGVQVRFWTNNAKYKFGASETLCAWPFERAYVSSDMRVVPCCYVGNPDVFEMGKIGTRSLSDIWFSDEYKVFRQSHFDAATPRICGNCYECGE